MGLRLLALALTLTACAGVPVLDAAPEHEARRAREVLARAGIAATAEREGAGWRVSVRDDQVARAVVALGDALVPRREEPGFAESWGERALVTSEAEERARAAQAAAGELARTLEAVEGVLDARVHVTLPVTSLPGDAPRPGRASVLVIHATASPPLGEAPVRALVAGAVEGMRAEDVAVVFSRRAPRGAVGLSAEGASARAWGAGAALAAASLAAAGALGWRLGARHRRDQSSSLVAKK